MSGENNNIMTKTGANNWMGTICENELDKSIEEHKWKIKLLKVTNKYLMVGVAPIDFDINSSSYNSCGWYYYCYNSCLYSGPPFNYKGNNTNLSKVNGEIIVVMNMKKRTLKFIINNEDKEDSFNDFLKTINSFGKVYLKSFSFKECPKNINDKRAYSISGENNNIITKTGLNSWMGTICENELDKSIEEHKCKIKLLNVKDKDFMVGVAPNDFDINSSDYSNCGWYFYCYHSKLFSGPPFDYENKNTNLSKVNNEIIIVMNMKKRTLNFIINNEDKGNSYTDIPIDKPLFPAILLHNKDDFAEISEL